MDFFSRWRPAPQVSLVCKDKSLTQQQFRDDADINVIIKRYSEPGHAPLGSPSGPRVPLWGDFSNVPDLQTAQRQLQLAEASFASLPSQIRERFRNNPLELLAFVQDSRNRAEAEKLGLLKKEIKPTAPVGAEVDSVAVVNGETITAS